MKYVMLKARGVEVPILFPAVLQHRDVVEHLMGTVMSAGSCRVSALPNGELHVDAYGNSLTLGIGCREQDARLIREHLQYRDV